MDEEQDEERSSAWKSGSFWNRLATITLGYGGFAALMAIWVQGIFGGMEFLEHLDRVEQVTVVLIGGTLELQALRSRFFVREEWPAVQRVALTLTCGLAALCAAKGDLPVAFTSLLAAAVHVVAGRVMKD